MKPARLDNLVLDTADPEALVPFWCGLLDAEVVDRFGEGQYVEIGAGSAGGISIILQRVPEQKSAKNRMHADLEVDDLDEATGEIERLGGRWRDGAEHEGHGFRWRVMADPEGNEFCIFPADRP